MTTTDPVCGMQIEIEKAAAQEEHDGWAYFFCSPQWHRMFRASPERYTGRKRGTGAGSGAEAKSEGRGGAVKVNLMGKSTAAI